jgi:hypothetical protein
MSTVASRQLNRLRLTGRVEKMLITTYMSKGFSRTVVMGLMLMLSEALIGILMHLMAHVLINGITTKCPELKTQKKQATFASRCIGKQFPYGKKDPREFREIVFTRRFTCMDLFNLASLSAGKIASCMC